MIYFNIKTKEGIETIDELNPKDFKTFAEFKKERKSMYRNYILASSFYSGLYISQRSTKEWANR